MSFALAQTQTPAPVEERRPIPDANLRGQQAAENAFRQLQNAERARVQAEQEAQRVGADYAVAQKRAEELNRAVAAATRNLEAARGRGAQVRKEYDAAVQAVDQRWREQGSK